MKKKVRVLLYAFSVLCIALIGLAMFWAVKNNKEENRQTGEEIRVQDEVTEETEESYTEAVEEETETVEESTTLLFAGDVLFAYTFPGNYDASGIDGVLSEELLGEMVEADITMVNEEFPFSKRGTPMEDKQFTFRADPAYAGTLNEMGVDIVTLANNHVLDYGGDALTDTLATLKEQGILYVGAGESVEEASALQVIEVNGKKFGFLAASRVIPVASWNIENKTPGVLATYDETLLVEKIREADALCDVLTVYVHWGVERSDTPEEYQRYLAEKYVEAGADVVIGSHPHVLQGIEYIDGKPVFYSLGNFMFNHTIAQTMAVKITVDDRNQVTAQIIGATAEGGKTRKMDALEQQLLTDYLEEISFGGVTIDEEGIVSGNISSEN